MFPSPFATASASTSVTSSYAAARTFFQSELGARNPTPTPSRFQPSARTGPMLVSVYACPEANAANIGAGGEALAVVVGSFASCAAVARQASETASTRVLRMGGSDSRTMSAGPLPRRPGQAPFFRRRGRATSSPPQFGQTPFIASVQATQKVHSKLQIRAGPSALRAAPHRSQTGRISSAIRPSSVPIESLQRFGDLVLAAAVGHLPLPRLLERRHRIGTAQLSEAPRRRRPRLAVHPLQPLPVDAGEVQRLRPVL